MANCKKCDRCGSYYDLPDVFKKDIPRITKEKIKGFKSELAYSLGGDNINFDKVGLQSPFGKWLHIDLCPKCGEEFYKWLMNEEKNNGEPRAEAAKEKT